MDLRSVANSITQSLNPNETVRVFRSTGYTIGVGRKQVPTYAAFAEGPAQIQALDSDELKHVENLNLQGTIKAIYLRGSLAAVVKPDSKGGDLVQRKDANGVWRDWLVVKVLEGWATWTKAVIVLQEDA